MNKAILIGNLTHDPHQQFTKSGKSVANFNIAVSDRFNKDHVDYFDVTAWGNLADLTAQYLTKGKKVGVVGRLTTRTYETKDGQKRKVTEIMADEIEFLSPAGAPKQETKNQWDDIGREVRLEDIDAEDSPPF